jgi:ParB-like chromosome segregation protein Spo0J
MTDKTADHLTAHVQMHTYRYEGTATLIPIGLIHPSKMSGRKEPKLPRLQKARDELAAGMTIAPIAIFDHDGEYLLADGMHRYTAAKEAGLTHLPCVFWTSAWPINRDDWE